MRERALIAGGVACARSTSRVRTTPCSSLASSRSRGGMITVPPPSSLKAFRMASMAAAMGSARRTSAGER